MKVIKLQGFLDERMQFPKIEGEIRERLDIDLSDVEQMNSTGCRNWVIWIQKLRPLAKNGVFLHNCPSQFISHASVLTGLIPVGVTVQSFYVPYFCESCGASERMRFELGKDFRDLATLKIRDSIVCPVCSSSMKIDVIKENFLRFMARKPA